MPTVRSHPLSSVANPTIRRDFMDHPACQTVLEAIRILRREAATRAEAEASIAATYESATGTIRAEADRRLAETKQTHAAEIEANRKKHAELQRQVEQWRTAEQAKIDEHRKAKSRDLTKKCEETLAELKEEELFEQVRFKEVFQAKSQEPQQKARAWEQKLTATLAQLDKDAAAVAKQLTAWGVKEGGEPGPARGLGEGSPVERIAAAGEVATAIAGEILNDPAAKQALADKIIELLKDDSARQKLSREALEESANFDWQNIAESVAVASTVEPAVDEEA